MNLSRATVTASVTQQVLRLLGDELVSVDPNVPLSQLGVPSVFDVIEPLRLPWGKCPGLTEINDQTTTINDLVNAICGPPQ